MWPMDIFCALCCSCNIVVKGTGCSAVSEDNVDACDSGFSALISDLIWWYDKLTDSHIGDIAKPFLRPIKVV